MEVSPGQQAQNGQLATTPIYRAASAKDKMATLEGITTLYDLFQSSVQKYGDRECLGWRNMHDGKPGPYEWSTYKQTQEQVAKIGSALVAVGLKEHSRCGVFSTNCPEWMTVMQVRTVGSSQDYVTQHCSDRLSHCSGCLAWVHSRQLLSKVAACECALAGQHGVSHLKR